MPARPTWPRRHRLYPSKREGDDIEAINRLFTPEFRNRLDAIIPFGHLPPEVVHMVVAEVRHAA
jgi:ATP-dependent Clp protease ATP-binding subunit ClpA